MQRFSAHGARRLIRSAAIAAIVVLTFGSNASAFVRPGSPGWQPPNRYAGLLQPPKYVFVFVIDGGVPSYLNLANFPHVSALVRDGVNFTRAWSGILESETPSGHASLGTGSLPRHNGVLSFKWVDIHGDPVHPTNPIPIQQGALEQVLKQSGAPSLASLLHQYQPGSQMVVTSGHKDYAVDSVGGWAADYLMFYENKSQTWAPVAIPRHVPPQSVMTAPGLTTYAPHMGPGDQDHLAVQLALSAFRGVHPRVTVINLPEFDWPLGHLNGGILDTWFAWRLMTGFDSDLAAIEAQLKQEHALSKTLFVLTADHGMVPLNHEVDYTRIGNAVRAAGTSLVDYDFHTGGYLWVRDRERAEQVSANIVGLRDPHIKAVYYQRPGTDEYVHEPDARNPLTPGVESAFQYLLGTFAGATAPQVVILLTENSSILGRNQNGWKGDHGGADWGAQHIPLIFSGAGVRHHLRTGYPATIYDVAPTILATLGIPSNGMDGVPLANALLAPTDDQTSREQTQGRLLTPLVQALIDQSARDGR